MSDDEALGQTLGFVGVDNSLCLFMDGCGPRFSVRATRELPAFEILGGEYFESGFVFG